MSKWINIPADPNATGNETDRRLVLTVLGISLVATALFYFTGASPALMIPLGALLLLAVFLASRGRLQMAGLFGPLAALVIFIYLIFNNYGIRDTAILGLPVVIIAASLMNGRRGTIAFGAVSLAVVIALGFAESRGWIVNRADIPNLLADYVVVGGVVVMTTALQWAVIGRLREHTNRAHRELAERQQAEKNLQQRAEEMYILYQTSLALSAGQDLVHALEILVTQLQHLMVVDVFYIGLYDEKSDIISFPLFVSEGKKIRVARRKLHSAPGLSGEVIFSQKTLYIPDLDDPAVLEKHPTVPAGSLKASSFLGIPLTLGENRIGIVSVQSGQTNAYSAEQIRLLETLAAQIAVTIEKSNLFKQLQKELAERRQAERALRTSEERYRSFIAQSTEGIRRYDMEEPIPIDLPEDEQIQRMLRHMYIAECNDAFARMYGLDRASKLIGRHLGDMGMNDDPVNIESIRAFIRAGYRITDGESREIGPDGKPRIYLLNTVGMIHNRKFVRAWGTQRDITERTLAKAKLQRAVSHLTMLNQIGRATSALRSLDSILEIIRQQVEKSMPLDAFMVGLFDPATSVATFPLIYDSGKCWSEPGAEILPGTRMSRVFQNGESLLLLRTPQELEEFSKKPQGLIGDHSRISASLIYVPMYLQDKVIGAISAQSYSLNAYTYDDLELLQGVAIQAALAIENARLFTSLQQELAVRQRAETEVRRLNDELEQRVAERTAQLEDANKELEAFSYSVSHDLRAPLRSINGFSDILLKDFSGQIDPMGLNFLTKVVQSAHEMNELVESMLKFSHLSRGELRCVRVDLSGLAAAILEQHRQAEPERPVTWEVAPGLSANVDPTLIRNVLDNLLGNAWKYTAKTAHAHIAFGVEQKNGENIYHVRDNGAGFDMKYAGKLFGAFQRLHRADEFPGHGIGLASVQRIIHRHGGRIWAEAAVGQGATFYFTLPSRRGEK